MKDLDRRIHKPTGLERWYSDLLSGFPILRKRGRFLLGMVRLDGALRGWVVKLGKDLIHRTDPEEQTTLPRIKAIRILSELQSAGWIITVYHESQQKQIAEHMAYTTAAMKDKTPQQMCETIAKSGILRNRANGKPWTADEIWNNLPPCFMFKLGELHMDAVEKLRKGL